MQQTSCYCLKSTREATISGVSFFWRDGQIVCKHNNRRAIRAMKLIPNMNKKKGSKAVCLNYTETCLMLTAPGFNHSKLIKSRKKNLLLNPLILSTSQIQFYVQISWFAAFHFSHCADAFAAPLPPPPPAGRWRACALCGLRSICLAQRALVIQVGGWTRSSGGWKCPNIGSQRGLKKQRTMPLRWEAQREQRFSKQEFKNKCISGQLIP